MNIMIQIPDDASDGVVNYWQEAIEVLREVLAQGLDMGFGMSLVEIKFMNGQPTVLIRSISATTKYADNEAARKDLERAHDQAEREGFDGSRTYTEVYTHGKLTRILLDEYSNRLLK